METIVVEYSLDSLADIHPKQFENACKNLASKIQYNVEFVVGLKNRETVNGETVDCIVERAFTDCCCAFLAGYNEKNSLTVP
jgi:hypothetical protein